MDVIVENVRCFQGEHKVRLAPITLLVGENNTGKSTFLAVLSALRYGKPLNVDSRVEGDLIFQRLAGLLESTTPEEQAFRDTVDESMARFGQESGLFDRVVVERLDNEPSMPFQLTVHQGGLALKLHDAGAGVSQILPIVVQSLLSNREEMLLIQQPEGHLHPRAQAALGSFFVQLANTNRLQFVIETHSDYLVDRVRQEVARGAIDAKSVTILFFEKTRDHSKIYPISLDAEGNILNPPAGYRRFFLEEELRLLTRGKRTSRIDCSEESAAERGKSHPLGLDTRSHRRL